MARRRGQTSRDRSTGPPAGAVADRDRRPAAPFGAADHDHRRCVAEALDKAEALCRDRGARLTKLRRRVLELVWTGHAPVGAYEVLNHLSRERARAAPPTVYRALEFLLDQGLVHRIESLNAFVGCPDPDETHSGQFLICRDCGTAAETHDADINRAIARRAAALGFAVEHKTVELRGLCSACRGGEEAAQP